MRTHFLSWIGAIALCPALLFAESLQDAAQRMADQQVSGWNAMDAEAWAADFTDDSEFVNIVGTHFTNRAQNVERHAWLFNAIFRGSTLEAEVLRVRPLTDDVGLVHMRFALRGHSANPPGVPNTERGVLKTHISFVLQRIGGVWHIAAAQNTAIAP